MSEFDLSHMKHYRFTADGKNVYIEQLEWGTRWVRTREPIDAAFIAEACNTYFRLRVELAEHARRAALVATWAEGLRAGKRYAVTVDGREWYAVRRGYWDEHYFAAGVTHATEGIEEIAETSENRTAAYMLAVSDQWQEVEP